MRCWARCTCSWTFCCSSPSQVPPWISVVDSTHRDRLVEREGCWPDQFSQGELLSCLCGLVEGDEVVQLGCPGVYSWNRSFYLWKLIPSSTTSNSCTFNPYHTYPYLCWDKWLELKASPSAYWLIDHRLRDLHGWWQGMKTLQEAVPATQASRPDQPSSDALVSSLISLADSILPSKMILPWINLMGAELMGSSWTCLLYMLTYLATCTMPCRMGNRLRPCWSWVDSRAVRSTECSPNVSSRVRWWFQW